MDGVQYQAERLQHTLARLDTHRMLNQEDAAHLQIALANATAIARRVVERQSLQPNPMTEHSCTVTHTADALPAAPPLVESVATVASQHGIATAELREHNPQLAAYGDTEQLPLNTFIKLRLRVETPRRVETPGDPITYSTPKPLAPTPNGSSVTRAKELPLEERANLLSESQSQGFLLQLPSPNTSRDNTLDDGVPMSLLHTGRVLRPPTTTPGRGATNMSRANISASNFSAPMSAVSTAKATAGGVQDHSFLTNDSSSFQSTPTPTPFSSPPPKEVPGAFPVMEELHTKESEFVEPPLALMPQASGSHRATKGIGHIARTLPKSTLEMERDGDYDTLNTIAAQYGVLTKDLFEWNPYLTAYKVDDPLPPNLPIVLQKSVD